MSTLTRDNKNLGGKVLNGTLRIGALVLGTYFIGGSFTEAWTSKQIKENIQKTKIEQEEKIQYQNKIDSLYNKLFENADSLDIYKKYGLPIKLLKPTLEQKEWAIEQNELEKKIKQNELEKSVK